MNAFIVFQHIKMDLGRKIHVDFTCILHYPQETTFLLGRVAMKENFNEASNIQEHCYSHIPWQSFSKGNKYLSTLVSSITELTCYFEYSKGNITLMKNHPSNMQGTGLADKWTKWRTLLYPITCRLGIIGIMWFCSSPQHKMTKYKSQHLNYKHRLAGKHNQPQ